MVAKNLRLPENWPVLQIERKAYDVDGNLIEYMILSYEASRYAFVVEMELNAGVK
jgi:DNA-binding GntR family transcriptional regulator